MGSSRLNFSKRLPELHSSSEPSRFTASLVALFLLLIKVWISFPGVDHVTDRLQFFQYVFFGMFALMGVYFIQTYRSGLLQLSVMIFIMIYGYPANRLYNKFALAPMHRLIQRHKWIGGILGVGSVLAVFMFVFWLALRTSTLITSLIPF